MSKKTFTRIELYELVWTESLPSLSKKYNIPYSDLRNLCIKMSIPLPKAGHWEKVRVGKPVFKEELPDHYEGKQEITLPLESGKKEVLELAQSPLVILQKEIELNNKPMLIVPNELINPDRLIVVVKRTLLNQKPSFLGRDRGLVHSHRGELDIRVSPENVDRILTFMDTLIKLLRARGHDVRISNDDYGPNKFGSYVIVKGIYIKVSLREKMKRIVATEAKQEAEFQPTGILCFQMDVFQGDLWQDGKVLIENQLSRIIAKLEIYANKEIERHLRHAKEEEKRRENEHTQRKLYEKKRK